MEHFLIKSLKKLGEIYADKLKGSLITEDRDPVKVTENVDSVYQKVEKFQTIKSSLGCVEVRRHGLPGNSYKIRF